jgi:hypothetical protein
MVCKVILRTLLQTRNLEMSVQTSTITCAQIEMLQSATKHCHLSYIVNHNKSIRVGQNICRYCIIGVIQLNIRYTQVCQKVKLPISCNCNLFTSHTYEKFTKLHYNNAQELFCQCSLHLC